MTRIAIVGRGNVGSALRAGLERAGHEVQAVGRDPDQVREAGNWGEAIVLAVPFAQRQAAVRELGDALEGKPLLDVTNAVGEGLEYVGKPQDSGAEELQRLARGAKVVKAFNTVFAEHMAEGRVGGEPLTAFVAGDDAGAKRQALGLASGLGFEAVDAGPLSNARWLEPLGYLNISLGYKLGLGSGIGFRLVRAEGPEASPEAGRQNQEGARRAERPTRPARREETAHPEPARTRAQG